MRKFFNSTPRLSIRERARWFLRLERLLLVAGILALLIYGSARLYSWSYQAYTTYSFEEQLRGGSPSVTGFLARLTGISKEQPQPAPPKKPPVSGEKLLRNMVHAPEIVPENKGWSSDRLKSYRKAAPPAAGSVLGRLEISTLDLSVMLLKGTDNWTLNRAVGHIEGTSLPGQNGNLGIAGHRDGFFRCLKDIKKDTTITLTTLNGRYQYRVSRISIARPNEVKYLAPTPKPTLTLVTCYPFHYVGDAPKRYIVTAELVKMESADDLAAQYNSNNQKQGLRP